MNTEEKASAALRLSNDEAVQLAFSEILEDATRVFLDAGSTRDAREQAHTDVRSIQAFRSKLTLWGSEKTIADHKQKGQHRG